MKINHRIGLKHDDPFWAKIDKVGLEYERGDSNNVLHLPMPSVLSIAEDEPAWPEVERLVLEHCPTSQIVSNVYTNRELEEADWLLLKTQGHHGYPEPDIYYHTATDDLADYCPICGIGGVQTAPFRLRAEPKASHSQFIQLNWVYDEFFLRDRAREILIAAGITNINFLAPVLHTSGRPVAHLMQMRGLNILPPALETVGLSTVTCNEENEEWETELRLRKIRSSPAATHPYCARVKYRNGRGGMFRFRRNALCDAPDVTKSHEWFGSGGSASQLIIVSQRFRQVVVTAKLRGVRFEPIELIA